MSAVKRVLLLAGRPDFSGVSMVACHLAAGLRDGGADARLWFTAPGPGLALAAEWGVPAQVWPAYGSARGSWWPKNSALAAARAFAPDFVHAQSPEIFSRALRLARAIRAPLAVTVHQARVDAFLRAFRASRTGVVAVSDALYERLANAGGVPRDRLVVIHDALDMAWYARPDFTAAENIPQRPPVVGTCGSLCPGKGRDVFVHMAARLVAGGLDAEFVVMGEGTEKRPLRQLVGRLGIASRVTFASPAHPRHMAGFDVLVEPSMMEGLGYAVLQAMALGVPVVAAGAGGIFDLVSDGETGWLVPPGDAETMARAVWRLLRDPTGSAEMARRARDRVEQRFDAGRAARAALDFYLAEKTRQAVS